jgi:MFS family permease
MKKENKRYKWEILTLLWIAFFLNQADRQVFNVVLPLIKSDLQLTDFQIGFIATAFNLVYALIVPLAGYAGDLFSKKWIITISVLFWSIATMFTGLCNGMLMLILMRSIATGGGEAFFGPANYSLLAQYHKKTRAFAMSIHQTSYYIGLIVSGYLAGYIGENYGWRNAFFVFGAMGVIHGIVLIFRLKENRNHQERETIEKINLLEGFKVLFRTPTGLMLTIGFSGLIFVLTGYLTWMPTFLFENFDMNLSSAGFHSMFYTHLFAFIGIILAGKYSDRFGSRNPASRMMMQGIGLLIAVPFILVMGNSGILALTYIGFAGFGFARAFFDANTYTVLYDVIPEKYYSTASGVMIMIGFAVGSMSPVILGYIKPLLGLSFGLTMLAAVWAICGLLLILTSRHFYKRDYDLVH